VTLQCKISRARPITNQTYRTRNVTVGTAKKSMATMTSVWAAACGAPASGGGSGSGSGAG